MEEFIIFIIAFVLSVAIALLISWINQKIDIVGWFSIIGFYAAKILLVGIIALMLLTVIYVCFSG